MNGENRREKSRWASLLLEDFYLFFKNWEINERSSSNWTYHISNTRKIRRKNDLNIFVNAYGRSFPTNFEDGLNRPIPQSADQITLAEFGFTTTVTTDVLVIATIGWEAVLAVPEVLFTVLRDGVVIGTARAGNLAVDEEMTTTLQLLDIALPPGFHSYTLLAEITNGAGNEAAVTGPVSFTGVALTSIGTP